MHLILTGWQRQNTPRADYIITSSTYQFRITGAWRHHEANDCHDAVNWLLITYCWTDAVSEKCPMAPKDVIWKQFSAGRHVVEPIHVISCYFMKVCLWIVIEGNTLKVRQYPHHKTTSTTEICTELIFNFICGKKLKYIAEKNWRPTVHYTSYDANIHAFSICIRDVYLLRTMYASSVKNYIELFK